MWSPLSPVSLGWWGKVPGKGSTASQMRRATGQGQSWASGDRAREEEAEVWGGSHGLAGPEERDQNHLLKGQVWCIPCHLAVDKEAAQTGSRAQG